MSMLLTRLLVTLQSLLTPARARVSTARGANFIEYALLAVIAVAIFVLFKSQLSGVFTGVFSSVKGALTGSTGL